MSSTKEAVVSSMLQSPVKSTGLLIAEVGAENTATTDEAEEPTMLELMMAAQAEAKKEKDKLVEVEKKKTTKSFGSGFKKGFFAGSDNSNSKSTAEKQKPTTIAKPAPAIVSSGANRATQSSSSSAKPNPEAIPTISKKTSDLVIDEVQEAMREDENPMLKHLKQGEWMTPDLMSILQTNPIIAQGLMSKKCSVALSLMQQDPNEAKKRFGNDPEVSLFLQEFGKVMAAHFEGLGSAQTTSATPAATSPATSGVQEIGPLHSEVLKRSKEQEKSGNKSQDTPVNDAHVQQVLSDPELRDMLMDPNMQRILQECGDPALFQRHMRDPVIAAKIRKLYAAGLVGTAK